MGKEPREIKDLRDLLRKVASSDSNITILGESGTGKELVAHAIHKEKWGNERPLVCVNCAAIARDFWSRSCLVTRAAALREPKWVVLLVFFRRQMVEPYS